MRLFERDKSQFKGRPNILKYHIFRLRSFSAVIASALHDHIFSCISLLVSSFQFLLALFFSSSGFVALWHGYGSKHFLSSAPMSNPALAGSGARLATNDRKGADSDLRPV
jgi:hypothetical protein